MATNAGLLNRITIAAPCPADWDQMFSFEDGAGRDRVRFCSQCNLNVYNLSAMSARDAELLVARTEGRLCVRFYRRSDGTVLTQNCPVGLRAIKRKVAWVGQALLGMLLSLISGAGLLNLLPKKDLRGLHMGTMGAIAVVLPDEPVPQGGLSVQRVEDPNVATIDRFATPTRRAKRSSGRRAQPSPQEHSLPRLQPAPAPRLQD